MAVGKGSIGRVSKAVEKQIPALEVEIVEEAPVVEEVVAEPVVDEVKETPAPVKKTTTRKKTTTAKKPATRKTPAKKPAVKEEVVKKDNCQVGDKMPVHLM